MASFQQARKVSYCAGQEVRAIIGEQFVEGSVMCVDIAVKKFRENLFCCVRDCTGDRPACCIVDRRGDLTIAVRSGR